MKNFVVCVSDSASSDRRTSLAVQDDTSLGEVARMAIDEFVSAFGADVQFPLFVDIHLGEQFGAVHLLHSRASSPV